jgi:hypothetical protein
MQLLKSVAVPLALLALCSVSSAVVPTGPPLSVSNLALSQPSIQSTTYTSGYSTGGPSKFNVDGNTDNNWFDGSCISTVGGETWPWWAVDLGASHTIQYVVITKETTQPTWLANFTVALTNVSPWVTAPSLATASAVCFNYPGNPAAGGPAIYFCQPCSATGRYLFLTMYTPSGTRLVTCEVEAYGFNYPGQ